MFGVAVPAPGHVVRVHQRTWFVDEVQPGRTEQRNDVPAAGEALYGARIAIMQASGLG